VRVGPADRASLDAVRTVSRYSPGDDASRVKAETLSAMPEQLRAQQKVFASTGGLHGAALFDANGAVLTVREDIGRHNAVDKVMGAALQAGRPTEGLVLLVTGRISGELAFKAARARMSLVATPSVPSSIAVDIARAAGMTLVGRAVSGAPQVHDPSR